MAARSLISNCMAITAGMPCRTRLWATPAKDRWRRAARAFAGVEHGEPEGPVVLGAGSPSLPGDLRRARLVLEEQHAVLGCSIEPAVADEVEDVVFAACEAHRGVGRVAALHGHGRDRACTRHDSWSFRHSASTSSWTSIAGLKMTARTRRGGYRQGRIFRGCRGSGPAGSPRTREETVESPGVGGIPTGCRRAPGRIGEVKSQPQPGLQTAGLSRLLRNASATSPSNTDLNSFSPKSFTRAICGVSMPRTARSPIAS